MRRFLGSIATFSLYALHRFNQDGCFAASGALSYTTLVSLVPLGVIGLGVLSAFPNLAGSREELLQLLFRNFVPGISAQAAWWFQYFAGSAAQATAIGIIGTAAVGVLLLVTVEDQLNAVWRVTVPRPWVQRVLAYWTLITMGPLLIGTSLTLSTYLNHAARRAGLDPDAIAQFASGWPHLLARSVPFLLEWLACALLYIVIPNCAVRWRDAMLGATVASISIELLKIGFVIYIGSLSSYQIVYGAIATIPIFLLWMYVSWMAVLLGAVVAANLPTWKVDERFHHMSSGGVRLGFSLSLIAALDRGAAPRRNVQHGRPGRRTWCPDLGFRRAFEGSGACRIYGADAGRTLGAGVEPRDRDIARSLSRAGPAARRDVAGHGRARRGRGRSRRRWSVSSGPRRRRCA